MDLEAYKKLHPEIHSMSGLLKAIKADGEKEVKEIGKLELFSIKKYNEHLHEWIDIAIFKTQEESIDFFGKNKGTGSLMICRAEYIFYVDDTANLVLWNELEW